MVIKAFILDDITKGGMCIRRGYDVLWDILKFIERKMRRSHQRKNEKEPLVRQKKNQGSEMSWKPSRERISRQSKRSARSNTIDRSNKMNSEN